MRKFTNHWWFASDAKKLTFLNHCALMYRKHYTCQQLLGMPLKIGLHVSSCGCKNFYHRHFYLSAEWWHVLNFFLYHNTNFHGSFVINCMNVENVESWGGFLLVFCCYLGFFNWIMKCCSGVVHSVYSKGLWYFPWGMKAFSRVCIKTALIWFQNNFTSVLTGS